MSIGAVTTIFHTSRELFLMSTALVLTYNYGRLLLKAGLVLAAAVLARPARLITWSAIYYARTAGRGKPPRRLPGRTWRTPGACNNDLYFLLVKTAPTCCSR